MKIYRSGIQLVLTALITCLMVLTTGGCSKTARAKRSLERAEKFRAELQMERAEIEYLNVLKLSPVNARAISGLGLLYYDLGAVTLSVPYVVKARELSPANVEIRMRHAMLMAASGDRAKAREDLAFILQNSPKHPEAPLILVDTAAGPQDFASIEQSLKSIPAPANEGAPVLTALGLLALRQGKTIEGETLLLRALAVDPKYDVVHIPLIALALARNNLPEAEKHARAVSDLAPIYSPRRMQLAQFKLQTGDVAGAQAELEKLVAATPGLIGPKLLLANILGSEKKTEPAIKFVTEVIGRDPANQDALLLRARLHQMMGKFDLAAKDLDRLLTAFPGNTAGINQLALLHLAQGETNKAMAAFIRALNVNPDLTEAAMMLAELHLRQGNAPEALILVNDTIKRRPRSVPARLLLAEIYRTQGRVEDARSTLTSLEAELPNEPQLPLLRGGLELQFKNIRAARAAFERSFQKSNQGIAALEQLTSIDIGENRATDAIQRIQGLLDQGRKETELLILLGRAQWASKNKTAAEDAFRRAIQQTPENRTAYFLLARLYIDAKETDKALENLRQVVEKNPKDTAAWLLTGVLHEQKKDFEAAKSAYEKLLVVDPKFGPALNNLAYIYSEKFNRLNEAQELANRAREANPNDPYAADTLGWILYRQGKFGWALGLVKEAAEKLPGSGEVQYHLGLIHYRMGEEVAAQEALQKAIQLEEQFNGRDDALARLDVLKSASGPGAISALEARLRDNSDDPIAQGRLATVYRQQGQIAKAVAIYENMLKVSPENLRAIKGLASIRLEEKNYSAATELAKSGRKIAAEDAELAKVLGLAAWATGDRLYAYTMTQEASRRLSTDGELSRVLGDAAFSQGKISEAISAWTQALSRSTDEKAAKELRDTLAAVQGGPGSDAASATLLAANPKSVAGLYGAARAAKSPSEARTKLEEALALYPEFYPAMRELAVRFAESPVDNNKVYDMGNRAREFLPGDRELARAVGLMAYQRNEYARAASLLAELTPESAEARLYFYLGKSQSRLKGVNAKPALERALSLGLTGADAEEAKRLLK